MPLVCPRGLLSIYPRGESARTAVDSCAGRQGSVSARGEDRGMALTNIQREVCSLLARQRIASGESYVAGGATLNTILDAPRISQDLDLFHDTAEALAATWSVDRTALLAAELSLQWHAALENAIQIIALLHYQNVGYCVLRGGRCRSS